MRYIVWLLIPLLLILHQDYWLWTNETLVWGFIPIGFFWHMLISLLAAVAWFLICWLAWPAAWQVDEEDPVGPPGRDAS